MKSGDLRESVGIWAPIETKNASGYVETVYTKVCDMAAKISSVSGKDFYAAYAAGAADVLTVSIRWLEGLTNAHEVSWNGIRYEILEINYLGARRDFMTLKCRSLKGTAGH